MEPNLLNKDEALRLLKELTHSCPFIGEKSVAINESNPNDETSKGFQIVIGGINKDNKTCLRKTVEKYKYLTKEDQGRRIIIYDPKQIKCPECGENFISTTELKKHITSTHYSKESEQTEEPTGIM